MDVKWEKRANERLPVQIWVEGRKDNEVYYYHTGNISEGGLSFEGSVPHPIGTIVKLSFKLPDDDESIEAEGEIVNVPKVKLGMGIKFINISEKDLNKIREYVSKEMIQIPGEKK